MKYIKYVTLLFLVCVFVYLSSEVYESLVYKNEKINQIDIYFLSKIVECRTPLLNNIFTNITALGSETIMFLLVTFGLLVWFVEKNFHAFFHLLFASVGSVLLILIMKNFIGRQRPDISYQLIVTNGFSYPSGHSLISSAVFYSISSIISYYAPKKSNYLLIKLFLYLLILLICFSRIYLGVHFLSDVFGGALLGIIYAQTLNIIFTNFLMRSSENVQREE